LLKFGIPYLLIKRVLLGKKNFDAGAIKKAILLWKYLFKYISFFSKAKEIG
jgi:hypothetical protein